MLPGFLQAQIGFGHEISGALVSVEDFAGAIAKCLTRDDSWVGAYADWMQDTVASSLEHSQDAVDVALAEAKFIEAAWDGDFERAAKSINDVLQPAEAMCENTLAWCLVWLGYATERLGDATSASRYYGRAHRLQTNIPRPPPSSIPSSSIPMQVENAVQFLRVEPGSTVQLPRNIDPNLWPLNGEGTASQTEEALKCLGQYLGFESSRPEKDCNTGPDILWLTGQGVAICMEAKTEKSPTSVYKKGDIGQLNDHVQWIRENTDADNIIPIFVGPVIAASSSANPSQDVLVVELEQFHLLGERLVAALSDVIANALPATVASELNALFSERELLWPSVFNLVDKHELRNI